MSTLGSSPAELWPWLALIGLGLFHGVNPAMGWLFAVALGLQQQKRSAVWRALPPIALGHALSVGVIITAVLLLKLSVAHTTLKIIAATVLFGFGFYRLIRSRHPKWVGMRVGFRDLTVWSFIMASAHGAGLMLVPLFIGNGATGAALYAGRVAPGSMVEPFCTPGFASFSNPGLLAGAVGVHTLGHLLLAAVLAILVYEKLGVAMLGKAWFNLDLLWVVALITTATFILIF